MQLFNMRYLTRNARRGLDAHQTSCYTCTMRLPYHFTRPPHALRKAKLDNIALVPASLLFQKARYKAAANNLPAGRGSVLICTTGESRQRKVLENVASYFQGHGHKVTTIPMEMMLNNRAAR